MTGCAAMEPMGRAPESTYEGLSRVDTNTSQSRVEAQFRQDEIVCYRLYKDDAELMDDCYDRAHDNLRAFSKQEQALFKSDINYRKDERKAQKEAVQLEEKRIRANDKSMQAKWKVLKDIYKTVKK